MGSLSERLSRRQSALMPRAKELVKLTAASAHGDFAEEEDLYGFLQACLSELSTPEFEQLLTLARDQISLRDDAQEVPFVMERTLSDEHDRLSDIGDSDDPAFARGHRALLEDLQSVLEALGHDLAKCLEAASVLPLAPLAQWHEAAFRVDEHQRVAEMLGLLRRLAHRHCDGYFSKLAVHQPNVERDGLQFAVLRTPGQMPLGSIRWRLAHNGEDRHEMGIRLLQLVMSLHLMVQDEVAEVAMDEPPRRPDQSLH